MRNRLWCCLLLAALASSAGAARLEPDRAPEPLRPWIDWVLYGHEEARCPFLNGSGERRECLWPSQLTLDLADRAGTFRQRWQVHKESWAPLPGDAQIWPQKVKVDGAPVAVTVQTGVPSVHLRPGQHLVSGSFSWGVPPPMLPIPRGTGLLELTLRGRKVPFPIRDVEGRLWLDKVEAEEGESRLEISVHRRIVDDIPLTLVTRLDLEVAGKNREILFGKALPDRFVPMSIQSHLPARLDPDGRLRAQLRSGRWTIEVTARGEGPIESISLPAPGGLWDEEEVWAFDARPHLRIVTIENVRSIDPQQTTLPKEWRSLPAYLVAPGSRMELVERRRGDADPPPDQLSLDRFWYLDFSGRGFTVRDRITGQMERGWRLEMQPPAELGRVSAGGRDLLITRRGEGGRPGVEVRQDQLSLDAESRLEGRRFRLPAVGWDHDFQRLSGQLRMPPGWRLFHAWGVDEVHPGWIASWTLLDVFLVLIAALGAFQLWGRDWGLVALAALCLTWVEPGAPRWTWIAVLAVEAVGRVAGRGRAGRLARLAKLAACAVLVVVSLPFMIQQVRAALHPVMERPEAEVELRPATVEAALGSVRPIYKTLEPGSAPDQRLRVEGYRGGPLTDTTMGMQAIEEIQFVDGPESALVELQTEEAARERAKPLMAAVLGAPPSAQEVRKAIDPFARTSPMAALTAIDPEAILQTGPGLPNWQWRSASLIWHGPVKRDQPVHLLLVPPPVNFILAFVRVGLVALLGACILGLRGPIQGMGAAGRGLLRRLRLPLGAAFILTLGLWAAPARADVPPREVLDQLRDRLLRPPECTPNCASIPRMALDVSPRAVQIRLEAHAAASTAVPLPGGREQWVPDQVLLDGSPEVGLVSGADGRMWLHLLPGSHDVLMRGALPDRGSVHLALPLKPRRVTVRASGWHVEGLHEDGRAEDALQLVRLRALDESGPPARATSGEDLPPFVRVERRLELDLEWRAATRVRRLTPASTAMVLEVPLLPGEAVTSGDFEVSNGKLLLTLPPGTPQVEWRSTLEEVPRIFLRAPENVPWTEVWRIASSPVWHLETEGIPVVLDPGRRDERALEWFPWPGEEVRIEVTRPVGSPGQSLTIDQSLLSLSPGLRATEATLLFSARSSRGGHHSVRLPEGALLQSVSIGNVGQPIRQEGRQVLVPLRPGRQDVSILWRQEGGLRPFFRAPEVDLDSASVNVRTRIALPAGRWLLLMGGPPLGPAVLFWSLLLVILPVSWGLGRARLAPLDMRHWFLLGLGLTQVPVWAALIVVGWLLALEWRRRNGGQAATNAAFDLMQVILVAGTMAALLGLFWSIERGLLGLPEMQVQGNGSSARDLLWYLDRTGETLPRPWVLSVPVLMYRLFMLAWALWLAHALLGWLRWGWECFTRGGSWRPLRQRQAQPSPQPSAGAP